MTDTTTTTDETEDDADRAEFRAEYGFDRPHIFQPIYQLAGGGVKFTAGHSQLPCWTFVILPRHEQPSGFTIEVYSIGQNPLSKDEGGEQIYGPPTLQRIVLDDGTCPTLGEAVRLAKNALWYLIQDLENEAWSSWRFLRQQGSPVKGDVSCN